MTFDSFMGFPVLAYMKDNGDHPVCWKGWCTDKFLQVLFPGTPRKLSFSDAPPRLPGLVLAKCVPMRPVSPYPGLPVNRTRFLLNSRFYIFFHSRTQVTWLLRKKLLGARSSRSIIRLFQTLVVSRLFRIRPLAKHVDPSTCSRKKVIIPVLRWQFVAPSAAPDV